METDIKNALLKIRKLNKKARKRLNKIPYTVEMSIFRCFHDNGNHTYEITFNRSLQHTGKFKAMSWGLNMYDRFWIIRKLIDWI